METPTVQDMAGTEFAQELASGTDFAQELAAVIETGLETIEPLMVLKILVSLAEDIRTLRNRLEVQDGFKQLTAALEARVKSP